MTTHPPNVEELVVRYLDRQLTPEEEQAWEEHYFSCDACFPLLQQEIALREHLSRHPIRPAKAATTAPSGWTSLLRRLREWGGPSNLVLAGTCAVALFVAARGVILERRQGVELESLREPRRIVSRVTLGTARSGGELPVVSLPSGAREGTVVSFHLLEPVAGGDLFRVALVDASGREWWRDVIRPEGMVTTLSLVMGPEATHGEHRLRVEEIRESTGEVLALSEQPFRIVPSVGPPQSSRPTSTTPDQ